MDVHIALTRRGELSAQIYRQLLEAILDGRLRPGERLPPTRDLADRLDVSRNTVALAYERLVAEGVLVGRVGAGTFVGAEPIGALRKRHAPLGTGLRPRDVWQSIPASATSRATTPAYDFRVGIPDIGLFPFTTWRRMIARALRSSALRDATYGEPGGHAGLRAAIARHVGVARAVRADADDVIVTHGAQQALDLVGRVLIEPGMCVAVEEPGYPPARMLFRTLGARVVGVPVDAEGLDVARLPKTAAVVYVTPSHQFPLGIPMSLARRAALLAWAERRGAVVIEDDYDSEFRFGGRPLDPLQRLDRNGRVIYVGSFSKVLLPALRLGFLIAPASLQPALRAAKRLTDWHGELANQAALAHFIDQGLLARHIRKAAREYAARQTQVAAALRRQLRPWLRPVPSIAGLHVAAVLASGVSVKVERVMEHAAAQGVTVRLLADFCADPPARAGLIIGYGAIATGDVSEGLQRLAASFRACERSRRHGRLST